MLYGPALSALMHGVRGINFYEQRYIFAGGKNDAGPTIEKIFNLTAFLEQQGLMHYRTPRSVAVLYSRASEDWWQLAHASNPLQAAEGILYQNAVMEVLFRNGVPFDLYYVDQPATLDELGNYALAILPYPYSVGTEAGAKIRNAIGKGTAVISLKHRGEVDEFAERRTPPLLDTVPGIADVRVDLSKSSYAELSTQLMRVVANSMPAGLPLTLHANGRDIECSMQQNDSDRLVFCLNWEMEPAEIGLGLSLKEGTYAVSVITLDRQSAGAINGRSALTASDLRNFHLALAPGEAKILSVKLVQTRR